MPHFPQRKDFKPMLRQTTSHSRKQAVAFVAVSKVLNLCEDSAAPRRCDISDSQPK
jgi:hypothetical protein